MIPRIVWKETLSKTPYLWFICRIWRHGAEIRLFRWHVMVMWKESPRASV